MALASGVAMASVPGMLKKAFEYNRDNFMEDREQRMKKEFAEMKYKITQAGLWREDVRDFVSLTEMKMSLYLIVNVLLLGFTMTLWCEGQLPESTPDWLVMGNQTATVSAFAFLLLTVWLAMHASVAAQAYQTRVLTQLVRLPIPTWNEIEACRTAASEFEKVNSRQMFRVPFAAGKQENYAAGNTAAGAAATTCPVASRNTGGHSQEVTADHASLAADPWGLERRGDDIYELGEYSGMEVAKLRHMKLMRQAAVYWQTYDAFARVSMSVGINQLMLAMIYYILGYALLEARAPYAAFAGVIVLMGTAEVIARVDLSLPVVQQRIFQCLLGIGPVLSCIAAYAWSEHVEAARHFAEMLAPLAYISNGFVVGLMTIMVQVTEQENGAMLPLAFRGVLFLDVFGWASEKEIHAGQKEPPQVPLAKDLPEEEATSPRSQSSQGGSHGSVGYCAEGYLETGKALDSPAQEGGLSRGQAAARKNRPAASAVVYDSDGRSLPSRPSDAAPPGTAQDYRDVQGAPRSWEHISAMEPGSKDFWDPVTFMPPNGRTRHKMDELLREDDDIMILGTPAGPLFKASIEEAQVETGHDNEKPGEVPWRIFRNMALLTSLSWIFAGVGCIMKASFPSMVAMGLSYEDPLEFHHPQKGPHHAADLLQYLGGESSGKRFHTVKPEPVTVSWPYWGIVPKGLSCDARGNHLMVTDGLSTFVADVSSHGKVDAKSSSSSSASLRVPPTPSALPVDFKEVKPCPGLLGESLQDTALVCSKDSLSSCEALVLHKNGGRLSSCSFKDQGSQSFDVAESWLGTAATGSSSRLVNEQASFLLQDPSCTQLQQQEKGESISSLRRGCTSVGTTHGRTARLQVGAKGHDLVPLDVMDAKDGMLSDAGTQGSDVLPDGMRSFTERYLGVLRSGGKSIDILDLDQGGAFAAKLPLSVSSGDVTGFCSTGSFIYLMGSGPHPQMWRIPVPEGLAQYTSS
eukprot:CAMPEP_0115111398 /NCGR_PEP_ID=MMETSP0227-20121206/40003_1 /TAXON_ID=89957 /ORGANISM="Polarella glacialis, Strain CCMP 1383" /LENGTH=971 /DNA_ID=CAMNT_0002510731 /DNA_START=161 /DNA_END=3076 /DNA_ORIENTATION=+